MRASTARTTLRGRLKATGFAGLAVAVAASLSLTAFGAGTAGASSHHRHHGKHSSSKSSHFVDHSAAVAFKEVTGLTVLHKRPTMRELKSRVATYEQTPKKILETTPVKKKATPGKTIALLVCGVPVCAQFNDAASEAAKLLGWKVIDIPLGVSPQQFTDAYNTAIQDHPDLVVGSGLPRSYFTSQLKTLASMTIPVIEWSSTIKPVPGHLWVATNTPLYQASGIMLAEFLAYSSHLKGHVVTFSSVQYSMTQIMVHTLQQYGPHICPKCKFTLKEEPATDIGKLGPIVVSYLQKHSDTKYVFCGYGDLCQGVGEALKTAGFGDVKILTRDSSTTDFENIKNGLEWAALPLPIYQTGYQIIDLAQRIFNHQSTAGTVLSPMQIVTHVKNPSSPLIGAVPGFKAQYEKLWKLKS